MAKKLVASMKKNKKAITTKKTSKRGRGMDWDGDGHKN